MQNFAHGPLAVDNNVTNSNSNSNNESNANEVRKLQDENNQLVKKNNGKNVAFCRTTKFLVK